MTTRIKILIGILVVGIILIGAFWIWNEYFRPVPISGTPSLPKIPIVTITTDKTEYEQGDRISVIITNKTEDNIFYSSFPFILYKYENDKWEIFLYPWREELMEPQVEDFENLMIEVLPETKANTSKEFSGLINTKWMSLGRYKIEFKYTFDSDEEENDTIFSNEFTIK